MKYFFNNMFAVGGYTFSMKCFFNNMFAVGGYA